jgi:hypothetical protein
MCDQHVMSCQDDHSFKNDESHNDTGLGFPASKCQSVVQSECMVLKHVVHARQGHEI